jgi:acid phosphatase type 7
MWPVELRCCLAPVRPSAKPRHLRLKLLAGVTLAWAVGAASDAQASPNPGDVAPTESAPALTINVRSIKVFAPKVSAASSEPALVSANWNRPEFDDRTSAAWVVAPGPVIPSRDGDPALAPLSSATTAVAIPSAGGSLYFRMRFDVASVKAARSLELSVLYRDGFVAFLNGVEIARRNLPARSLSDAGEPRPRLPHGADPEHIYLPVGGASWRLKPAENLLAVQIIPAVTRGAMDATAPAGQIAVAAFSRVRLVRGPYLLGPSDDAISVAWDTDLPARGTLFFEKLTGRRRDGNQAGALAGRAVQAPLLQSHQLVRITGLEPGQRYRYRVEVEAARAGGQALAPHRGSVAVRSSDAEFDAAPTKQATARFVVYGDMRAPGHAAHAAIVAAIVRERPALVLNSGDLVATGSEESAWQRYFEITAPMGAMSAVVPALGNHEAYLKGAAKSWSLFGLSSASATAGTGYTSLDWGGIHFVVLDTNNIDTAQRDWLVRDLAAARRGQARAIIALCHDGPWSHGIHGGSPIMEHEIAPLLVAGGVDVLFAGHDHLYERGTGIVGGRAGLPYVISGGGGAPLYNPACAPITPPGAQAGHSTDEGAATAGLPACPAYVATIKKAHHYVEVEVDSTRILICPRAPDGVALEPCVSIPLAANRKG